MGGKKLKGRAKDDIGKRGIIAAEVAKAVAARNTAESTRTESGSTAGGNADVARDRFHPIDRNIHPLHRGHGRRLFRVPDRGLGRGLDLGRIRGRRSRTSMVNVSGSAKMTTAVVVAAVAAATEVKGISQMRRKHVLLLKD